MPTLHRSIGQTLEGSFSAVSKPNFASKYAFFSIFKLYKICTLLHHFNLNILAKNSAIFNENFEIRERCKGVRCRIWIPKTVQRSVLCRSRRELSNEYLLAKFGFDTAENEPLKLRITDHTFDHIPSVL